MHAHLSTSCTLTFLLTKRRKRHPHTHTKTSHTYSAHTQKFEKEKRLSFCMFIGSLRSTTPRLTTQFTYKSIPCFYSSATNMANVYFDVSANKQPMGRIVLYSLPPPKNPARKPSKLSTWILS